LEGLCKVIKEVLGDNIENLDSAVDSPCCFVIGDYGWTANMEDHAMRDWLMAGYTSSKKAVEIMDDLCNRKCAPQE
jgi:hypothetical protein